MNEIPDDAQQLLAYLVGQIHAGRFAVGNHGSYVSYSEVLREMRLDPGIRKTPGQALQEQGMEALAVWARANGHPAITGLIVVRENNQPSDGYWTVNGLTGVDEAWWDGQIRRAFHYDWNPYLPTPIRPFVPQQANDIGNPNPERFHFTATRIVRDTRVTRRVKEWHKDLCQICKIPFKLFKEVPYSEGHHIRPLGNDHKGEDVEENVLCVCPNCHARLDYGGISLVLADLNTHALHWVNPDSVAYHNEKIYRGVL